jgi:hypothetical protein
MSIFQLHARIIVGGAVIWSLIWMLLSSGEGGLVAEDR